MSEIIPPKKRTEKLEEYFAEVSEISMLPEDELRALLEKQLDELAVRANHGALRAVKALEDPMLYGKARELAIKEMIGLGMFADSVARQRAGLTKTTLLLNEGTAPGKPAVEIPKTLDDKTWNEKYGNSFMDKTAKPKTN